MRVEFGVRDFLDRGVAVFPDRPAVVDEPGVPGSLGRIDYRRLGELAAGMAAGLERMGVGPGERVAIVSPNAARFLVAYFGVSAFGRILVPVNYRLTPAEIDYILEHSGSAVVLVDPELAESLAPIRRGRWVVMDGSGDDAELFSGSGTPTQSVAIREDDTASINYTSGTTARPKGVQLTHRNLWVNAVTFGWHAGVGERDVLLHTLPMFHCNGWGMPYAATAMGAKHVVVRKIDGEEILRRVEAEGVTVLCGAPAVVAAIVDAAEARLRRGEAVPGRDQVRMVVAGAPPPSRTIERLETEVGWEFIQIYGLTETSPLLTVNRRRWEWDGLEAPARAQLLSRAGTPAIGVRIALDSSGEVLAAANQVFEGYWRQPEATAEALRDGWFHTGDGGYMEDGYLVIADRKKDVIISGGENISSIEVEDVLYQHPAVAEAAVIGVPDERWGETPKALVVLRPGTSTGPEELIEFCRDRLAHFKCPTSVELVDALPRTATGKLQKFRLRERYWAGHERRVN